MRKVIEGRELIALDGPDGPVLGTYHRPYETEHWSRERVGVLFLNGLYATRAGNGDAATYWASSLSELGYPSFRIDLPGFGDSGGDPPTDWLGYINAGGYAPAASAAIKGISQRFGLSRVVITGHCAGAVSAIYTAAVSKECCGLLLLDPYFHLPQVDTPKVRQELNLWSRRSRIGGMLSRVFDLVKRVRLVFHRNSLPKNANIALLRCCKEVASSGVPILILRAPSRRASGVKPRMGEFDYLHHILWTVGRRHRIQLRVVDGANHSFSNREGRLAVRRQMEGWLHDYFPLSIRAKAISELPMPKSLEELA